MCRTLNCRLIQINSNPSVVAHLPPKGLLLLLFTFLLLLCYKYGLNENIKIVVFFSQKFHCLILANCFFSNKHFFCYVVVEKEM